MASFIKNRNIKNSREEDCNDLKLKLRLQLRQRLERSQGMYRSGKA